MISNIIWYFCPIRTAPFSPLRDFTTWCEVSPADEWVFLSNILYHCNTVVNSVESAIQFSFQTYTNIVRVSQSTRYVPCPCHACYIHFSMLLYYFEVVSTFRLEVTEWCNFRML